MTNLVHDGAGSLRVEWLPSRQGVSRGGGSAGWFVVRTCACHKGVPITRPYTDRGRAEQVLAALDEDARRYGAPPTLSVVR